MRGDEPAAVYDIWSKLRVPRMRGDEPLGSSSSPFPLHEFPACAGMNR